MQAESVPLAGEPSRQLEFLTSRAEDPDPWHGSLAVFDPLWCNYDKIQAL